MNTKEKKENPEIAINNNLYITFLAGQGARQGADGRIIIIVKRPIIHHFN